MTELEQVRNAEVVPLSERLTTAKGLTENLMKPTDLSPEEYKATLASAIKLGYSEDELSPLREDLSRLSNDAVSNPSLLGTEVQLPIADRNTMIGRFTDLAALPTDLTVSEAKVFTTIGLGLGLTVDSMTSTRQRLSAASNKALGR